MDDWREFVDCGPAHDRYCGVNLHAYSDHNTIEIRIHSATLDADKVINWVKAHIRFVDGVKDLTMAQVAHRFGGDNLQKKYDSLAWILADEKLSTYLAERTGNSGLHLA